MDTLKCIISKANSIRFAHVNGLMRSFDNRLSWEETWNRYSTPKWNHSWFKGDQVLIQVKAGLTATVVLTKILDDGTESTIVATDSTTYVGEFIIYDYLIPFSIVQCCYFKVTSQESEWISEWNEVFEPDEIEESLFRLIEWSNEDPLNDSFEFDYQTTTALSTVNFMRIKANDLEYSPAGEAKVFNNQNEITKLKSNLFRKIVLKTDLFPRQIAELLTIAMQHDLFQLNEVGYVLEELPELTFIGAMAEITAELTLKNAIGFNTHDIGYTV